MDGVHDLGGLDGFGPVEHTDAEPYFEQDWERRAFRLMMGLIATQGIPGGRFRHSIERMAPEHYLSSSYYEHWLTGAATMAVESGFTTTDELERRACGRFPLSQADRGVLPDDLTPHTEPRYSVGDEVRVRERHPPGHTRAPRYVQGKRGTVVRVDGAHNIDDIEAHGGPAVADPLYSVRFTSRQLWGEAGADGEVMHVDLFERYLEDPQ
ncbi:nitrile hydratase subunit beta [Mycobacterium sp.]|uniref:nitrile hydratase subunit beta n=1 Tax=Mycobacterium sp. TaxID=1785 RepID=UPI002BFBA9D4|nr:nitrile hydratase subunit beta [Mycobacterium sp.]HKP44748.1 nitrile hydratase subunit beta [Mycobacterium sp.]